MQSTISYLSTAATIDNQIKELGGNGFTSIEDTAEFIYDIEKNSITADKGRLFLLSVLVLFLSKGSETNDSRNYFSR